MHQKVARFRDMRPPRTDSNLYSYHLNQLIKDKLVEKTDGGYTLAPKGLVYVDRLSVEKAVVRQQPKIVTLLVIQNSDGDVLLQRRKKQPFIDTWTLPGGKTHMDDASLLVAAQREATEKLGLEKGQSMRHAGDCYIRVSSGGEVMTVTMAHVFAFERDAIQTGDDVMWVRPHKLTNYELAPAVDEIIARTFFRDPFYFEEFEVTR